MKRLKNYLRFDRLKDEETLNKIKSGSILKYLGIIFIVILISLLTSCAVFLPVPVHEVHNGHPRHVERDNHRERHLQNDHRAQNEHRGHEEHYN